MYEDLETVLSPSRINDPKFVIPVDNDVTKAIPIIKEQMHKKDEDLTKTRVIEPIMEAKAPSQPQPKKPVEKPVPLRQRRKIGQSMLRDYLLQRLSFSYSLFLQKIYLARKKWLYQM